MKKHLLVAAALVAPLSMNLPAATDQEQQDAYEAECRKYALEDGIEPEEMESYMAQCMEDLAAQGADSESEPSR